MANGKLNELIDFCNNKAANFESGFTSFGKEHFSKQDIMTYEALKVALLTLKLYKGSNDDLPIDNIFIELEKIMRNICG